METANIHRTEASNLTEVLPRLRLGREELTELLEAPSHVYFIYSGGFLKIGFSTNWRERVDGVCQGCVHPAEMVLVMPGDRSMEAEYHALFHEYRFDREWFRCEGKVREFLLRFTTEVGREVFTLAEESFQLNQENSHHG